MKPYTGLILPLLPMSVATSLFGTGSVTITASTGSAQLSSNSTLSNHPWTNSTVPSVRSTGLSETSISATGISTFSASAINSSSGSSTSPASSITLILTPTTNETSTFAPESTNTSSSLSHLGSTFQRTSIQLSSITTSILVNSSTSTNTSVLPSPSTIDSTESSKATSNALSSTFNTIDTKSSASGDATSDAPVLTTSSIADTPSSSDAATTQLDPPGGSSTITLPPSTTTSYSDEEIDFYLSKTSWDNNLVTSTLSSDPTISGTQTSNSDWKKNFWLKTQVDGQPTDLPVVHCGCVCKKNCDSDDRDDDEFALWIVYFNVPKVPNIQISLPGLPDFHLGGCMKIKVPILNIDIPLGKCPPVSDNGKDGHKDPDDPKGNNKDPEEPNEPEPSNEPSSQESSQASSTTSSSSSSSSCSGAVVTDILTRISCPSSEASGTQCATSIETGTRSGCSLTGTASVTVSASDPACPRQSWPTTFEQGTGYSAPGSKYGTYTDPNFGSMTISFSSMSASLSIQTTDTVDTSLPTTLTTLTTITTSTEAISSTEAASSTEGITPSSTIEDTPTSTIQTSTPTQSLQCEDKGSQFFVGPDTVQQGISQFCDEVSTTTTWDEGVGRLDHKRIERLYNKDTDDQIVLIVSSMSNETDESSPVLSKDDCASNMTLILDKCPSTSDVPGLDWRHGGQQTYGNLAWLILTDKNKYNPGVCTFQVNEKSQDSQWSTQSSISDADDDTITPLGGYDPIAHGETNQVPGLYDWLYITAEQESLGFKLGNESFDQNWGNGEDVPRCTANDWANLNDGTDALGRTTNCWVHC